MTDAETRPDGETRPEGRVRSEEGVRTDPYPNHRFVVEIDAIGAVGFSEVRGISARVDDDPEADGSLWRRLLERDASWGGGGLEAAGSEVTHRSQESPRLELRRGVTDRTELWEWFREWTDGRGTVRTARVTLLDEHGDPARAWRCERARPVRWDGPTLSAVGSGVATETFELAHAGITEVSVE
ncbi:phage tail protein [Halorubrum sp. F4]|uniref:phage tail protein n=1 Tax=Halorubrum sp. F4 TaxID=2989715 RepID=UPI0024816A67|nr:phage tail protein [Halorubrum sp. F4]